MRIGVICNGRCAGKLCEGNLVDVVFDGTNNAFVDIHNIELVWLPDLVYWSVCFALV